MEDYKLRENQNLSEEARKKKEQFFFFSKDATKEDASRNKRDDM